MNVIKICITLALFLLSTDLFAVAATGKISSLRVHTSSHSNSAVVGHTTFELDTDLEAPCTVLYLAPEDDVAVSFLLAAKAQKEEVKIYYHKDILSPWNAVTCSVYAVDIP